MIVAGLTGGIASGKSTVSAFLAEAGAHIIDADQLAREVVQPGTPAHEEIRSRFGNDVVAPDGHIDRLRLGSIVFNDPGRKRQLEAIVHPRVFERTAQRVAEIGDRHPDAIIIQDIPLLLETGLEDQFPVIIVVYVPFSVQLQRLMQRDGLDRQAAMARIDSQLPIEEKKMRATLVIDNSGRRADTRRQAMHVFQQLEQMSVSTKSL